MRLWVTAYQRVASEDLIMKMIFNPRIDRVLKQNRTSFEFIWRKSHLGRGSLSRETELQGTLGNSKENEQSKSLMTEKEWNQIGQESGGHHEVLVYSN